MSWARHVKGGAQSPPFAAFKGFPEVNQVPIRCSVDSESFPVFWPEPGSNLGPSAPQPSALTTRQQLDTVNESNVTFSVSSEDQRTDEDAQKVPQDKNDLSSNDIRNFQRQYRR